MLLNKIGYFLIVNVAVLLVGVFSDFKYTEILAMTLLIIIADLSVFVAYQAALLNKLIEELKALGEKNDRTNSKQDL